MANTNWVPADFITWEAEYNDGTRHKEKEGKQYGGIDRAKLAKFKLMTPDGNVLFETWPPLGKNGNHLVYRRRIALVNNERHAIFVVGWLPDGPAFVVDIANGTYRELPQGFDPADPEAYPPAPMPGELWFKDHNF